VELPFQQGAPLREDNTPKIYNPDHVIFMAILSETEDRKDDPAERVDLVDSDAEATEQRQSTMKFLHRHQESQ